MGRNIEIKARVEGLEEMAGRVAAIADEGPAVLHQVDTFFHCPNGRLKLREFSDRPAELIFYRRADALEPEESRFVRSPVPEPASLKEALAGAAGIRGVVRKRRLLYLVGRTRIHLDEVEGLGSFLELEVVLSSEQTKDDGRAVVRGLMERLGISHSSLVAAAYVDLLEHGG